MEKYRIIEGIKYHRGEPVVCYIPLVSYDPKKPYEELLEEGSYIFKTSQNNEIVEDQKYAAEMFIEINKRKK